MNELLNSQKDLAQYENLIKLLEEQLKHANTQNVELLKRIEVLTEQVQYLTKLIYSSKIEKSKYNAPDGQGSLFDDDPVFNESEHTLSPRWKQMLNNSRRILYRNLFDV